MSLNVGIDSYCSLEFANQYISDHYTSSDAYRAHWNTLQDADKEALLRSSCSAIDRGLTFVGQKKTFSQKLQFPRVNYNNLFMSQSFIYGQPYQYADLECTPVSQTNDGLHEVAEAQVENALYAAKLSKAVDSNTVDRIAGITSKKIGPIAETYNRNTAESRAATIGIYNNKVYTLLSFWLSSSHMSL